MTILRPGKKRRDPLGMHECWNCDCQFVVQHADPLPAADTLGDIWIRCPECLYPVHVNKLVEPAPA